MKTFFLKTVCWFVTACEFSIVFAGGAEANHVISADAQESYIFGHKTEVVISYRNEGNDIWSLQTPDDSPDVIVYYATIEQMENPNAYQLGTSGVTFLKRPDGRTTTAYFFRDLPNILIKPGEQRTLTTDVCGVWTGFMVPGTWFLWVEDMKEKIRSETVQFRMLFTKASVDTLLNIVRDIDEDSFKRVWHMEWLQKFKPDMHPEWPRGDEAPDKIAQMEEAIQNQLNDFETFWAEEKDSETVDRILKEINGETEPKKTHRSIIHKKK